MPTDPISSPISPSVQHGLRISGASLIWTVSAGSAAVVIGILSNSLVLAALGSVGLLDAAGSATLMVHFRHAIRHEAISERHERIALVVVSAGMAMVGLATMADSAYRLAARSKSSSALSGIVLAGVSAVVLASLALGKRRIARGIPSHALHADGWLSGMGAILACVTLAGLTLNSAFGWWWIDPAAAIAVALGAVGLSVLLAQGPRG